MIKKAFIFTVVLATVCWSMGLAAIMPALAATTISAGDLIKGSGSAVYYYGYDGKRYVFPTASTYFTWYPDFSGVKTITDAELAAIQIGGNVTVRPGTALVKITTDPKTYAVTPGGVLHHIASEQIAEELYGPNWNKRVIDIPDAFWVNYKEGSAIDSPIYPDGSLIKYAGSNVVYYVENGQKRAISPSAFEANHFQTKYIIDAPSSITLPDGPALDSAEQSITCVAGCSNSTTPVTASLKVALAANTPASGIVVSHAARVPFTEINLVNDGAKDVTVDSITVKRVGLASDADFASVDLVDASTMLPINTTSKVFNSDHEATFTKDFVVKAGTTRTLIIAGNMADLSDHSGETPALAVENVTVKDGAKVEGNFPIVGNYQTTNGSIVIGTATVERGVYSNATSTDIHVGTKGYTFFSFEVTAGSAEKVAFSQVKVYQAGSAALGSDLINIALYKDGTKIADGKVDGKYVNFTFSPIILDKGQTDQFQVKADVDGGSARTVQLGIYKDTDLLVKGETYGYNIIPTYSGNGSSTNSPVLDDNEFTISAGTLTVTKSNAVGGENITVGNNQILGAFDFTVKGEPIDITELKLKLSTGTSDTITNVELVDANGNVVAGPADPDSNHVVDFSDSFTVPVGDNIYKVRADLQSNAGWTSDETIYASINPASGITAQGDITGDNITASPAAEIDTNVQTVKVGSLTVTRDTLPADGNVIIGSDGVTLGSWTLDASDSGEDVRVTTIAFEVNQSGSDVNNLTLYANGKALSPIKDQTDISGGKLTFALSEPIIVPKGGQVDVQLKGDIASDSTTGGYVQVGITSASDIIAYGKTTGDSVTPDVVADAGAKLSYVENGTLTISTTSNPPAGIVIAGSTGNVMTKVKLKAKYEDLDLNKLRVYVANGGQNGTNPGDYQDIVNVSIYDGSTLIASHSIPSTGYYEFSFDKGTVVIPKGGEKILTIKADISTIDPDVDNAPGTAAANIVVGIGGVNGIKTTGNQSNLEIKGVSEIYYGSTSSPMTVHVTQPTVTYSESGDSLGAATSLTNGAIKLFAFKVSADASGDVLLYRVSFKIATTGNVDVDHVYLQDDNGNIVSASADTTLTYNSNGVAYYTTTFNNPDISVGNTKEALDIAAGSSKTYTLWGVVSGAASGDNVSVTLLGDNESELTQSQVGTTANGGQRVDVVEGTYVPTDGKLNYADYFIPFDRGNFIWSDNVDDKGIDTDGANATSYAQWYNGYEVNGLGTTPTTTSYVIGWNS